MLAEVWLHWALRCCRQWPESTTQMRLCGEAIPLCAGRTKACGFWAHHWDTQTLFVPSCLRCLRHMTSCSRRSSKFKISSVLVCSFSFVAALGQTAPSEWSTRSWPQVSQPTTTLHSGDASAPFSGLLLPACELGRLFGDDPPETPNRPSKARPSWAQTELGPDRVGPDRVGPDRVRPRPSQPKQRKSLLCVRVCWCVCVCLLVLVCVCLCVCWCVVCVWVGVCWCVCWCVCCCVCCVWCLCVLCVVSVCVGWKSNSCGVAWFGLCGPPSRGTALPWDRPPAGPPSRPPAGPPSTGPPSAGPPKISLFFFPRGFTRQP